MTLGLRALLLIAAVVCFIIAIFVDRHAGDWVAIGLALFAGSQVVVDLGWDRRIGSTRRSAP
jgi:uncharacterized membrane protein YgdD (TMEM256/DUF423 family)